MASSPAYAWFPEFINAHKDGDAMPQTSQDIETIMNKIIDARVEQKLAEYGIKPHPDAPAPGDPPKAS